MNRARLIEAGAVALVAVGLLFLAGPKLVEAHHRTRVEQLEGALGDIRTAIARRYSAQVVEGVPRYPSLHELEEGGVIGMEIPANPLTGAARVHPATRAEASRRATTRAGGWRYFVDNDADPPEAIFYADIDAPTHLADPEGRPLRANEL